MAIAPCNKIPVIQARKFYFCRRVAAYGKFQLFAEFPYETRPSARHAMDWARELLIIACNAVRYANKPVIRAVGNYRPG
jgi:hypothetical protein